MLTCYCPFSSCAARIPYETVKPTVCPQCRKAFADAFRTAATNTVPAPTRVRVHDDDPGEDRPLTKSALLAARKTTTATARPRPTPRAGFAQPVVAQPDVHFPDDGAEDEPLDPREVRRQARELAATIDTSTIVADVNALDGGDKPVKGIGSFSFRDMWTEGAAAREKATQAQPKVTKRKRR